MRIRTAGVQFMRDNPERFIESNTENSWLRYLNNMCIQGTWADALIIQAVANTYFKENSNTIIINLILYYILLLYIIKITYILAGVQTFC